jgi:hypothetical protein
MATVPIHLPAPESEAAIPDAAAPVVALKRRTIDLTLIGIGILATAVLAIAAGLLTWGNNFADDYVDRELSSQNITFPSAEALTGQGRDDLLKFADEPLNTGTEAEAYASYIDGHLEGIANGATYAELGAVENAAEADVIAAVEAGQTEAHIAELQATADTITGQRDSLFKGETLRGLLLSAYAWSTVGTIAGFAAIAAFIATGLMAILVLLGLNHLRRERSDRYIARLS